MHDLTVNGNHNKSDIAEGGGNGRLLISSRIIKTQPHNNCT